MATVVKTIPEQLAADVPAAALNLTQAYVDDEFIFYSFIVTCISIASYIPIISLLRRQTKTNIGPRVFD